MESQEFIQLINTAIIKTKEKKIDGSYEERLAKACEAPAIKALALAIGHLSEEQGVSHDQAAMQIVEIIRELDSVWTDYVMMEGLGKLRDLLKDGREQELGSDFH